MNLMQHAIAYSDNGRTTQPQVFFFTPQAESLSETTRGFGERLLGQPSHRYAIVSSGTSAGIIGRVCESYGVISKSWSSSYPSGEYVFGSVEQVTGAFIPGLTTEYSGCVVGSISPVFIAGAHLVGVTLATANTTLAERRQRDMAAAVMQREQQREKNKPAIGLLEAWLSENVDTASEAASLKDTIATLNTERSHSRKLFP